MKNQRQKVSPTPARSSFFGPPAAWAQFGAVFWGGVVMGICLGVGLGLLIGAELVEKGVITSQNNMRLVGAALVLQVIGIMGGRAIAVRSVRRSRQSDG